MSLTQINKAGLDEIALDHVFTIGASGSDHYTFQGEGLNGTVNDPTLYLTRGKTYRFENGSGGHPFRIQSTTGTSGTAYNTGVTNNNTVGTVIMEVQHDAPDVLYYQCTSHSAMNGILYITGALADGGVTTAKIADNAVTTAKIAGGAVNTSELAEGGVTNTKLGNNSVSTTKIADDAVTSAKIADGTIVAANIANDTITAVQLANNSANVNVIVDGAVTTSKIADQAVTLAKLPHGDGSSDGKFLRANNGADPTFETVSGTTITNNADNRVITGSNTANTVLAEDQLTFSNNQLNVHDASLKGNQLAFGPSGTAYIDHLTTGQDIQFRTSVSSTNDTSSVKITSVGNLAFASGKGIDFSATSDQSGMYTGGELFDDYERGNWTPTLTRASGSTSGTLHTAIGMYIKIGKLVYITFHLYRTGAGGGSSYYQIGGLPFGVDSQNQGSWSISPHMTRSYMDSEKAAGDNAIGIKFLGSNNTYGYTYNADTDNWFTSNTATIVLKGQMTYITAS